MRARLSYANVMATIAVFVALGGSSYAALRVTGKDVKDETLTGADVRNRSLTGADVKNNSLTGADLKPSSVHGSDIRPDAVNSDDVEDGSLLADDFHRGQLPPGPQGPKGEPGPQGPKGDTGTVDTSNFYDKAQSDARFLAAGAKAADADKLDGLDSTEIVSDSEYKQVVVRMQAGDEREIARNGPLSIYARCATVGANDTLRIYAKTDVDGAIMYASWGDTRDGTDATDFLDTTTPEANREFDSSANGFPGSQSNAITPTGVTKIVDHYDDNHLIAPTGEAISWEGEAELIAFNYLGARCLIAGTVHLYALL
jgi:hypothetical protein